ncbi:hypothetical protein GCM10007966_13260 [Legionella impletisoli]|uniref:Transmembrane protein n=1 Tax=Legionella impletisoli TaxID=343510 RepID=A0A917NBL9_9GAMM|nr:hypothetical protein GCM10007966_13260 [Legionella impletisoli]
MSEVRVNRATPKPEIPNPTKPAFNDCFKPLVSSIPFIVFIACFPVAIALPTISISVHYNQNKNNMEYFYFLYKKSELYA